MLEPLTQNEWIVMNALWDECPAALGDTIRRIGSRISWNRQAYAACMDTLLQKGYVTAVSQDRGTLYAPAVTREACAKAESQRLLRKPECGCARRLLDGMVRSENGERAVRERNGLLSSLPNVTPLREAVR